MSFEGTHSTNFPFPTTSNNGFDDNFKSVTDDFDATFRWAVAGAIISGLVTTVAIIVVVIKIIDCLKKAGSAIPTYIPIPNSGSIEFTNPKASTVEVSIPPNFEVVRDSQVNATMERFLSNIAREKPIRFSPQQLETFTEKYSTLLGSGGFGVVYKGEFPNGVQVAVKVLNCNANNRVEEQFMAEVGTMGRTYHINLVRLYGFCFDPKMRALVYEYMENGSLDKFLFSENQTFEWKKRHGIAIGTAKGIAYLHEECQQRIIHYDIKPGNVLVDTDFSPKVADFGLAKLCNRESTHIVMTGCRGTPGYAAPELWKPYPVTHKCDVYSFGMLLFEIMGRRRNHDNKLSEAREWLPRWTWESFEKGKLGEMMELCGIGENDRKEAERMSMVALWCVQYLPEARPIMSTVVKMLEGGVEIPSPPNPFQYLESGVYLMASSGNSGVSSFISSGNASEISYSVPLKRVFEIESS